MDALQRFRMGLLQQTENAYKARYAANSSNVFSPQSIAINAMLQSRGNLPAVAPVTEPKSSGFDKKNLLYLLSPSLGFLASGSPASKWVIDKLSRPAYGVGSALQGNQFEASAFKSYLNPFDKTKATPPSDSTGNVAKDFWRGFSGQNPVMPSQVVFPSNPNASKAEKAFTFAAGTGLDIAADPTSYLPLKIPGLNKLGKAAELTDPVTNAAPKVLEGNVISSDTASKFAKYALEGPKPGNRVFVGSPGGEVSISAPDVLRTAQAQSLTDQITGMPKLLHPDTVSVQPLFKDITETVTTSKPVIKQVEVPVEQAVVKPGDKRLADLRAIKLSLLQTPDYTINGFKVSDILRSAKATSDPQKLKLVDELFNNEAKNIYKSGNVSKLPKVGEGHGATFYGRSGEKTPFGLTVGQASDLLHRGEVGGVAKSDKFLSQFPVGFPEDLKNVHVHNSRGELVSLEQYLTDLGVTVKSVSQAGDVKTVAEPFKFDFEKAAEAPKTKTISKVVHETTTTQVVKSRRLNPAETIAWMSQHAQVLSPTEMAYLRKAGSRASFEKRLGELKAKVVVGNFKNLDEVIAAAESGMIPKDALDKLLETAGATSIKDLRAKALAIINKTGERPVAAPAPVVKPSIPTPTPKLQRLSGKAAEEAKNNDPFAVGATPAEQLVAESRQLDKIMPTLDEGQIRDLANALGYATMENIVRPLDEKIYPWVTSIKKSLRTSKTPGAGRARNLHGFNAYSQSDIFRVLIRRASADFKKATNVAGKTKAEQRAMFKARASLLYDRIVPELRAADIVLRKEGVKFIAGSDNKGLLLSLSDVIDALPRPLVEKYLFTPASSVYPTGLLDGAAAIAKSIINGGSLDVARADAYNAIFTNLHVTQMKKPEVFTSQVISDLMDHSDEIIQRVEENYAREAMKLGTAVTSMTDPVIKNLAMKFADPNVSMGNAFGDFMMRHEEVAAIGRQVKAPAGATSLANDLVDSKLAGTVDPGDIAEAKAANAFAAAPGSPKVAANQYAARAAVADATLGDVVDIGQKYESRLYAALFKSNMPLNDKIVAFTDAMGQSFVPHYGHRDLHNILRDRRSVTQDFSRMYSAQMGNVHKIARGVNPNSPNQVIQEAFRSLQDGTQVTDPGLLSVMNELKAATDVLFGHATKNGLGSFAQRNGFTVEHVNRTMEFYGVPEAYHFDPKKSIVEQPDIWKTWPTEDPLNYLDKTHAALQRAAVDVTVGASFSHEFGSAVKYPGMVKITDTTGASYVAPFVDKSLYYWKDHVEQLKWLDRTMKGSFGVNRFKNATVDSMVRKLYDPLIHMWKSGMTIWRPGHHVSNLIGDMTLSWFAGVNDPSVYHTAARIMGGRSKAYGSWDGIKALMDGTALGESAARGKGIYVRVNGSKVFVSDDQIWRAAFNKGLLPDYRTLEDVAFGMRQTEGMSIGKNPVTSFGKFGQRKLGGLSQARDHWVRIAHQIDVLQKGNFKSLEDAFNQAGDVVRKWHPDGSDLTNFESKYMRRIFMFYSWQRKAIPLVVETLVMKPGKALVMPKVMYNFARTMGIDPESLGDPFPNDQLFPSFLSDQVYGPQWQGSIPGVPGTGLEGGTHYRGINWPDPATQILNQYGGGDSQTQALGALSPVARVPLELLTGNSLRTGGTIQNVPEYIDQQIPGLGYVDKITGRTVTGLGSPIKDVQRGNVQPGFNSTAFFNWLTGLGQVDYSKPNYIKTAEFELRDKLRRGGK